MRRRRWTAVALVALFGASGCAGLPHSSSVVSGKAVDAAEDHDEVSVEPDGPLPGDDPRQIATGFLKAQISSRDGYSVARSFLAPPAGQQWKPGTAITVFSGESDIRSSRPDTDTVSLSVPIVARISADGHMTRAPDGERRTLTFGVTRSRAGWRLTSLPANLGVWLSADDLTRLYIHTQVYYPSAHGQNLVADPRWLPRQGLATALARAAVSPPPSWLAPAVHEPYPRGTTLDVEAVPVSHNGVATVDLTSQALKADNSDRSAMWATFTATLLQSPDVRGVDLTVGGSRFEAENLPAQVDSVDDVGFQPPASTVDAVIARAGGYLQWTNAQATDVLSGEDRDIARGRTKLPTLPAGWTQLAAGQGGRQIAAVSSDRMTVRRWLNGTEVTVDSFGIDLVRPCFDNQAWLWNAGRPFSNKTGRKATDPGEDRGAVWVLNTTRAADGEVAEELSVPWLGHDRVRALSVSPEGQRVAVVVQPKKGSAYVVVAAVVRDSAGKPVSLGPAHRLADGVSDVKDVAWADEGSLALLGTVMGTLQPAIQPLDGSPQPLGAATNASGLASTLNGESGLFVRTSNGGVLTRLGASWHSFLTGGDVIVPTS